MMINDIRIGSGSVPRCAIAALVLAVVTVAGCGPAPTQQASRDADKIIERAPSPAAGKAADPLKDNSKDATSNAPSITGSAAPAAPADDVTINIKVQDALKSNFSLKALPMLVQTTAGVVTLSGSVDTPENRSQAEQVVLGVAGVKSVQNKLVVSGT
jgi:hyperosmotically inducible periplasmic protein